MNSAVALVIPATSVHGISLTKRAVRGLLDAGCVRHVFICTPDPLTQPVTDHVSVVIGGVRAGLAEVMRILPDTRYVLVHEASRAATPPEVIKAVVAELERGAQAVVPVLPLTDTVKDVDEEGRILGTRDRSGIRVMQSPLGVTTELLQAAEGPLPAGLGVALTTVPGHPQGLRIRTAFDVATVTP
ncbi:2-C-methyl-D-erythritol 4-phosphate cytidylyltransferase [Actinocrispum sp. NPDC049592]|uniref:IspD/TarI family cytidylyltransferase n=1 Tax=Actinocrispum sp. NPDC049592 TaxID=3154835 RepID=UPI00343FC4B9